MSIRRIFLALVLPLFLLLAVVNGGLLYVLERAEAERGLESEAVAAAVTVAAFLNGPDRTDTLLADPVRMAALQDAVARSPGLESLWLLGPGRPPVRLAGAGDARSFASIDPSESPQATGVRRDDLGPYVLGLAKVADGQVVVARIDAQPLFDRISDLRWLIAGLIAATATIGLLLALLVARRIGRELARNSLQVAQVGDEAPTSPDESAFRIRETRDLSAAVRLMRASVAGRMARGRRELLRRDRARTAATSVAALRGALSPAVSAEAAGRRLAARRLGSPGPGMFVALAVADGRAGVVLAEVMAPAPGDALADAIAAQRFLETRLLDGDPQHRIEQAHRAYGIRRSVWRVWSTSEPSDAFEVLALADPSALAQARTYAARAAGLTPDAVLADLDALLGVDGAFAVIGPA
ncbi:MAG: hypothetical protein U1C74_11820 [Phenylobacterium sp.]|nr:hypothetical protein [Phenylobacterium sp.]